MEKIKTVIINENQLEIGATIIKNQGTVVFPTETVYGLGANALCENAVKKIFEAKGRPSDNPLIVHIDSIDKIESITTQFNNNAKKIANAFMPGPITMVLKKRDTIPNVVSANLDTVGIRCPKSIVARKFIALCDCPIAAPSANISGSVSATVFKDVENELFARVDGIIKGEDCEFGIESTVIDLSGEVPTILRPGSVTFNMIKEVLPNVIMHNALLTGEVMENPASPGMKYKHYSPKANVILVYGEIKNVVEYFENSLKKEECLFIFSNYIDKFEKNVYDIGSEKNLKEMANRIFKLMKDADYNGYTTIYIPAVKEEELGFSVMNRLKKSSGGQCIIV